MFRTNFSMSSSVNVRRPPCRFRSFPALSAYDYARIRGGPPMDVLTWLAQHWAEVLGFVTGAICVILSVVRNVWTYPIGIANNVVFVVLFVTNGLYANAGLQVVVAVLGAHGWWRWTRRVEQDSEYAVRTPAGRITPLAVIALAGTALLGWALIAWVGEPPTAGWLDAGTTAVSMIAQYMLNRKWIENWWVWFAVDLVYIGLYGTTGLWLTAVLYAGFAVLCVIGFLSWRRLLTGRATPASHPEAEVAHA